MAVFEINGKSFDRLDEAFDACREIWAEYKAPAVQEQRAAALAKPTEIDLQRAAAGVNAATVTPEEATRQLRRIERARASEG